MNYQLVVSSCRTEALRRSHYPPFGDLGEAMGIASERNRYSHQSNLLYFVIPVDEVDALIEEFARARLRTGWRRS